MRQFSSFSVTSISCLEVNCLSGLSVRVLRSIRTSTKRLGSTLAKVFFKLWLGCFSRLLASKASTSTLGTKLIITACPALQYEDICSTEGPDKPLWVNSKASLNIVPSWAVISASTAIPDNSANASLSSL